MTDSNMVTQTFSATTNASGVASITVPLASGVYAVKAEFAGNDYYLGSATAADTLVTVQAAGAKVTGGGWTSISTGRTSFGFNVSPEATGFKGQFQLRAKADKAKLPRQHRDQPGRLREHGDVDRRREVERHRGLHLPGVGRGQRGLRGEKGRHDQGRDQEPLRYRGLHHGFDAGGPQGRQHHHPLNRGVVRPATRNMGGSAPTPSDRSVETTNATAVTYTGSARSATGVAQ
ncbi:Ig-like domain-containing protein [Cryobacterium sp. TMT2-4]|uniref:Ig-like domain-containing protein n=1 Tax=Cryobacterium sp. TMT2-4 TaxID=1259254 RepID=UPI0010694E86|nr:Ig-like domain-containing protein [Cryobacterium sp. TMT2-4]TFC66044.1 Ig-like domain repeat protein [Cryobacterium sp. TMT2-4]